jgi:predicted transposase/invertase (TIGR01784 family)
MSARKRTYRYFPDQFHHLFSTALGQVYVTFLFKQFGILVKGRVINLPTVNLHKDPLETDTERLAKTIVDSFYKLKTKAAGESSYRKTVLQVEHQHRNQFDLEYRMMNYYNPLCQRNRGYLVAQILVYTGDYRYNSPTELTSRTSNNTFYVLDLTRLDPTEFTNDPHFGIQLLCIFSHIMTKKEKVRFLVEAFRAHLKKYGRKETQFYIDLLPLAMTKRNASAVKAIIAELSINPQFEEMIKQTDYYQKGKQEGREEGMEKGMEKGKIITALALIRNGLVSMEAVAQTLALTPEEIAAIQALLHQSSNGNGSNGAH